VTIPDIRWFPMRENAIRLDRLLPLRLEQAGIAQVELIYSIRSPSFRGSAISPTASALTASARTKYHTNGFGFWDFLLSSAAGSDSQTREAIFAAALRHSTTATEPRTMAPADLRHLFDSVILRQLPARQMVSISSNVRLDSGHEMQLPMLDFSIKSSPEADTVAVQVLEALRCEGDLFDSGGSYHFFGHQPVLSSQMTRLMGEASLLSPLIDARWLAHQLLDGRCALRISTDAQRNTEAHVLAATTKAVRL
jgi:hypothetical protein